MVVRLSQKDVARGRRAVARNEMPECRVQVPADIADLVEIRTKEQAIALLVQQRDARPENTGKASALARELFRLKTAFERRHGFTPYTNRLTTR